MRHQVALLAVLCVGFTPIEPCLAQTPGQQQEPNQASSWSFDIAGELRERFESSNDPVFGLATPAQNDYLLHRAVLSGEIRHGEDIRALVEVVSGLTSGWAGSPPPTQNDPLDLLQAYIEKSLPMAGGQLSLRAGRQELKLGASRLVSIRENPNIRRAFDGVRGTWTRAEGKSVSAFFVRPVQPEGGIFDDRSSSQLRFWGVYATAPVLRSRAWASTRTIWGSIVRMPSSHKVRRASCDIRSGLRAFGEHEGWDWNIEGAWQWGSFGESRIRAWTVSVDAGFEISGVPMSPRIGLKADAISGDRDLHDRTLGTFNPLFPKLPYFSEANLATPANLLDVQPNVRLALTPRLSATVSWNGLWKHQQADAYYAPPLSPVPGTSMTQSRDIGWQASMLIEWQATPDVELAATYVSFEPRSVIEQADGRAGSFFAAWVQWTF